LLWFEVLGMPPEDLIDSGVLVDRMPKNERLSQQ
jgi:hypothetical protein